MIEYSALNASIIAEGGHSKLHHLCDCVLKKVKKKVSIYVACELLAIDHLHAGEKLHGVE